VGGYFLFNSSSNNAVRDVSAAEVTVYKSPSCGCCVEYISILRANWFDVKVVETQDMESIKSRYKIPLSMDSCHTMIVEDYFVEGHVPLEAVDKLLEEKPDVDGIALPDMPAGSPGMPGVKTGPFKIYSLKDKVPLLYMEV
tara:strand:- start:1976 stop:2398 length:423 start_codon:yes stop_codon:yes gene_type:complete